MFFLLDCKVPHFSRGTEISENWREKKCTQIRNHAPNCMQFPDHLKPNGRHQEVPGPLVKSPVPKEN